MAGVSTGVSLLTVSSSLKPSIRTFLQMNSGANYNNEVTGVNATSTSGASNTQSTSSPVNATLGSFHLINNSQAASSEFRSILNSQVFPEISSTVSQDISCSFWLKPDSDGGFGASAALNFKFMLFGTGGSVNTSWAGVGVVTNNTISLYDYSSSYTSTTWTIDSGWHFYNFNFQYNGSSGYTVTCYKDGVLLGNSYFISRFDVSNGWLFCSSIFPSTNATDFVNGGMDNLSICSRLLASDEINYLYNSGNGRNYSTI